MADRLPHLEADIVAIGVFLVFVVTFGDYVLHKVKPIIRSWFED